MTYILAYDIGTTGVKTCLFGVDKTIKSIASASQDYPLYILPNGGAEQDGDDWWNGMCNTTAEIFKKTDVKPSEISGISFCSQMQGFILVDKEGIPVHRPMSYMDQRAKEEIKKGIANDIARFLLSLIPVTKSVAPIDTTIGVISIQNILPS